MTHEDALELALMLQNSNIPEVKDLALSYLKLEAEYGELRQKHIRVTSELIMRTNETLLKRLANNDAVISKTTSRTDDREPIDE